VTNLPRLSRELRSDLPSNGYPERVLQFGTGGFLRGFIGHFIDVANKRANFNGRIVAVGSTGSGRDRVYNDQDGLYTLWVRGMREGEVASELQLVSSFSRALSAQHEWSEVLAIARTRELELICSNTTEAGIALGDSDRFDDAPPASFPAKLTRVLWERAQHFDFASNAGVVVLPCELIENNGDRLRELILTTARRWNLDARFEKWVDMHVPFCNTLVDRIVPGEAPREAREKAWEELGYQDDLLTVCEPYRLFAIEAADDVAGRLRFMEADSAIVVTDDIAPYRLRKVRLLNGAHTILVPLALLSGCTTVADAVGDARVGAFLRHVLFNELVPSVDAEGTSFFAHHVLERFANPFIRHELFDITLQQTMKMRVRIVPTITEYAAQFGTTPPSVAFGFAAWLLFMRTEPSQRPDAHAEHVRTYWREYTAAQPLARAVARDAGLWGTDLTSVPGFAEAVAESLEAMMRDGVKEALDAHLAARAATA
jgi:tagaturonate reductase